MKTLLILLTLLSGCVAPVVVPPPPVDAPEPVAAHEPAIIPASVVVRRAYRKIERKLVPAITRADVTPDFVDRVHDADRTARRALAVLVQQDGHPTAAALSNARAAVKALANVLEGGP